MVQPAKRRFRITEVPPKYRSPRRITELSKAEDGTSKLVITELPPDDDERQFDVHLANGQSLRLRQHELEYHNLTQRAELQDLETGEEMAFADTVYIQTEEVKRPDA